MAVSTRIIRRRIKSVGNTKKITRAMELVAASKMRRAVQNTLKSRPYALAAWDVLGRLSAALGDDRHPMLQVRPVKRLLLIVVTSHRGLCGGFNANVLRRVFAQLAAPERLAMQRLGVDTTVFPEKDVQVDVVTVGRKGEEAMRRAGKNIVASFTLSGDVPTLTEAQPIATLAMREFTAGTYDKVAIAYTDFISAVVQAPKFRQLLPLSVTDMEKMIAGTDIGPLMAADADKPKFLSTLDEAVARDTNEEEDDGGYVFEPDAAQLLEAMFPRLLETQVYQALLESSASEHSSRMMAMRSASDAATDMIDDLTLTFNQARQASITREIAEIAAGVAAQN